MSAAKPLRNRIALFFLVAVFATPPLVGWLVYLNPEWLPDEGGNHGVLIAPPRSVNQVRLEDAAGTRLDWSDLADLWSLVAIAGGGCDETCRALVSDIAGIRRAIGASRLRTRGILIVLPDHAANEFRFTESSFEEGVDVLFAPPGSTAAVTDLFELDAPGASNRLYLVDTRGALMMRYEMAQHTPQDVVEDLELLLRASENWRTRP